MSWREHAWEALVGALSWLVAVGFLAAVGALLAFEAHRARRRQ